MPLLHAGSLWFLFSVEAAPCRWGWPSGLLSFPCWGSKHLCFSGWSWIFSLEFSEVSSNEFWGVYGFGISLNSLSFNVFLLCWRISMVCLAVEPVGSWVELDFSVHLEALGWALVYQYSLEPGVLWSSQILQSSLLPLVFSPSLTGLFILTAQMINHLG